MKKIVLLEKLTIFKLILFLPLNFFFEKIYYRDISENLKKDWVENFIIKFGILSLGFNDIDCHYYLKGFEIRKKLELNFIKNYVEKNNLYFYLIKKYSVNTEKFKLCLRGELEGMGDPIESHSISLIEKYKFLEDKIIYYYPISYTSCLLLKDYHNNLKVSSVTFLISFFFNIFFQILFELIKKIKIKITNKNFTKDLNKKFINLKNYKIAFFPHQGLVYGKAKAYNKNFYYNINENSKLNKKNILNIIREEGAQYLFTKRFFSWWSMPHIYMKNYKEKNNFAQIIFFLKKIKKKSLFDIHELILFFFISKTIIKIERNLIFFDNLPNLKLVLCDYDILFEKTILIACDIKKIKTVAIQDRYAVNTVLPPLFFNFYFITGDKFEIYFKEYGYLVDKYYSIGTSRTSLNRNKKKLSNQSEYLRINKINKKKILFVGLHINDKFTTRRHGEIGLSLKNNIFFFKELINISKKFKNFYFIVRLKNFENWDLLPREVLNDINNSKNLEIGISEKLNIYDLISLCDLVVARQTSLIEESLSDNIPVIVLDEMNFYSNYADYPLSKLVITVKNSEELNMHFDRFNEGKSLYSPEMKRKINEYFIENKKDLDFKSKFQNILEEII